MLGSRIRHVGDLPCRPEPERSVGRPYISDLTTLFVSVGEAVESARERFMDPTVTERSSCSGHISSRTKFATGATRLRVDLCRPANHEAVRGLARARAAYWAEEK